MASNSLFSTVTPCQQNFFWGKYCFADCCCVWSWVRGFGSWGGLGVRCWGLNRGIKGAWVKGVSFLDLIEGFGSKWVEGISWGHWGPCYQGPSFCGGRETQLSSRLFVVRKYERKKKKLSAFRDSSIYVMFINISERGRWHVCATYSQIYKAMPLRNQKQKHGWYFWQT